ncbi:MAG: carbohydrate-binding domain-containing protein [Paludibacteraceae bacterium]
MKKLILSLFIVSATAISLFAADYLFVHSGGGVVTAIDRSAIDSIKFTSDETELSLYKDGVADYVFLLSNVDSLTFASVTAKQITIAYSSTGVTVTNPFESRGIDIAVSGSDVTVNSTLADTKVEYILSGTTADGSFKLYSGYKYQLTLNGVNITNSDGPAINIQSGKKCEIELAGGTTNTLSDGSTYATSDEDQKSTLFSEGQLIFSGAGILNISSQSKHAICSDDYISVEEGTINVTATAKDAIHVNDYFEMSGGTLTLTPAGDGIDSEGYVYISGGSITFNSSVADIKAIAADSTLTVSAGTINLTLNGNQSKGLSSDMDIILTGGTYTINTSGAAVLEASGSGYDPSYCAAIKSKNSVNIEDGTFTITTTGAGGKGISADKDINISGGNVKITTTGAGAKYTDETGVTDAYTSTCLTADANITILDGSVILTSSGLAGKGISADGTFTMGSNTTSPTLSITTSGGEIASTTGGGGGPGGGSTTTSYASPKALKADGDITFSSGTTTISSTDDGIKSETNVYINGGDITVTKSYEGIEAPYIYINGGKADITASNDAVNATKGTVSGGTESNDGSCLYVTGGTLIASCTNGDGIDSNGNIVITGGLTIANGPNSGVEEAVDFNGTFSMNGGVFVGCGSNSNMTKAMSSSSTQSNFYASSSSAVSSSSFVDIRINGTDVVTFKPKYGAYKFLISAPAMTKGASYTIYTGGSYSTTTNVGGYYSGGTYSPGTSKKTGTLSSSNTVNTISF